MYIWSHWTWWTTLLTTCTTSTPDITSSSTTDCETTSSSSPSSITVIPTSTRSSSSTSSNSSSVNPRSTSTPSSITSTSSVVIPSSSNEMPTTITSLLTSIVAITSITPTSTAPQNEFFGPIEGLDDCIQGAIIQSINYSECNPADRQCICGDLSRARITEIVAQQCDAARVAQLNSFLDNFCGVSPPVQPIVQPNFTTTHRSHHHTNTSTTFIPLSTGVSNTTYPPNNGTIGPFPNSTTTLLVTTSKEVIITTDAGGQPTTFTRVTVYPVPTEQPGQPNHPGPEQPGQPGPTRPGGPEYTGAAGAIETPELFGGVRVGLTAGAIGLMGLVFAEL
ncbi:hypothetical protein K469DRAFT_746409 [Zopfia rhizophila CBS 207.26]|uniref:Extracellular membrane protein CFEM domain-containing protein n=1 Tax=Zopfia rhizophila CBS 207.26 TaxID=1314779 RepID=A0A6A6EJQ9_9PEZI|nr:hypothetical protein K469DRAFT_746409 [Zopfia rhizophila CBS 207.26]